MTLIPSGARLLAKLIAMRNTLVYWLAAAVSLLLMALIILIRYPAGDDAAVRPASQPPLAVSSQNPEAAYGGFYEALSAGNIDRALQFLSPEMREEFRREMAADATAVSRHLAEKAQLRAIEEGDCGPHEPACRRYAVYEYDYTVTAGYWETINEKKFYVSPGTQRLEMRFIQGADGSWQISEL